MNTPALYGLVLEGGLSSRMGKSKAHLTYHNLPQRDHVFELLKKVCVSVYYSANSQAPVDDQTIVDAYPFQGPLNGILSAFNHKPGVAWLTVPVDMPLVNEAIIRFLIDHRDADKVATCFYDSDGKFPEPLLTIWEPNNTSLDAFYAKGRISPREFLMTANTKLLQIPDQNALRNVNTPEDFDDFLSTR
ncbi:MAG: molybdenum cofactor guanylyltransferase [Cyclobacteriaceae bacterium]|nr:molybdenum cofactor guanylyltransferase [Cyclobacteriaceae bacterium]